MASTLRVLLIDDEPLVLEMFEDMLLSHGFEVVVASTAREALTQLDRGHYDVMVCDVMLEDFDGFDLLQIAKKKIPRLTTVLMTGSPNGKDSSKAIELGASYLTKPISFPELLIQMSTPSRRASRMHS